MPFRTQFQDLFRQDATIAIVVFALVFLAMAGALVAGWRRHRKGLPPSRRAKADRLEIGYVALLAVVAAFLVITGFTANARDFPAQKPALRVQVTAYQWCWSFRYPSANRTVTGQCLQGNLPALVVPTGEPVELDITSADVIHAFWVPYLRVKVTAYPGHTNAVTVTLSQPGQWPGRCAQLCGIYHYAMDFTVKAVPPAAFAQFLRTGTP